MKYSESGLVSELYLWKQIKQTVMLVMMTVTSKYYLHGVFILTVVNSPEKLTWSKRDTYGTGARKTRGTQDTEHVMQEGT